MHVFCMTTKPVHYLTWYNSCHYFRCTLVTLEKSSVLGEMMTSIFQYPYAPMAVKKWVLSLKPLNIDYSLPFWIENLFKSIP